ncbi:MAG: hypothetical protein LBU28_02290 [Spirochaetaceae bacterium]|nr:hypothetical protein [Spirochaetaceae bacterium]
MKRCLISIVFVVFTVLSAEAQFARGTTVYVAVKSAAVKSSTGFFARTLGNLAQGTALTVLQIKGKWVEGRVSSSLTGWIAGASLTTRRVSASGRSASAGELALAGKGFSAEIEAGYRQDGDLDYSRIDAMEAITISPQELQAFLSEGHLFMGE